MNRYRKRIAQWQRKGWANKAKKRAEELRRQEKQEEKRKQRFGKGDNQDSTEETGREVSDWGD